jgi:hypothetical protein
MEDNIKICNYKVVSAEYIYYGHFRRGMVKLLFEDVAIEIDPNVRDNQFHLADLFQIFDIDCEDGRPISLISGKYCRLVINKDKVIQIRHITNDDLVFDIV